MQAGDGLCLLERQRESEDDSDHREAAADCTNPWTSVGPAPGSVIETGLPLSVLEDLTLKVLRSVDRPRLVEVAEALCLPPQLTMEIVESLTARKLAQVDSADSPLRFHYRYSLMDAGKMAADDCLRRCHYIGNAPVPVQQYSAAVVRQSEARVRPSNEQVRQALSHLVLSEETVHDIGQAYSSGRPLMAYGPSGNGKSDIVMSVAGSIGGSVVMPHALYAHGHIIEVFDAQLHRLVAQEGETESASANGGPRPDRRWKEVRRPAVIVGGDMGVEALEIGFDQVRNVYIAPLSVRAQGGVLVIDDLGRQRVPIHAILNRWVQLMEQGYDSFSLQSSEVIRLPLDVTLVFSTNLTLEDLMDEAYLRRISYKIPVPNPTRQQFKEITRRVCEEKQVTYTDDDLEQLVCKVFDTGAFEPKSCYPRDIVQTVVDAARFDGEPPRLDSAAIDQACRLYLTPRRPALTRVA